MSEIINYKTENGKQRELEWYQNLFQKNKEIYILAGELNPSFYGEIIRKYYNLVENITFNFICGPYVAVEDELFKRYHDIHDNHLGNWWYTKKRGEWWKSHPVFEKAHENNKINIFIIKQRHSPHFCLGKDTADILVEAPHDELDEAMATLYEKKDNMAQPKLNEWNELKKHKCYQWDWENPPQRVFKPIYKINRELQLEKKLREEFSIGEKL